MQFLLYGMEAVNLCNNKLNTIDYIYMYMYMYSNAICKIFNAVLKTFCINFKALEIAGCPEKSIPLINNYIAYNYIHAH